ncbi:hypothetical protein IX51_10855 [uncultured archaeon]|nr:hypothetical protein IX51_10855 [uncultured archaeon]
MDGSTSYVDACKKLEEEIPSKEEGTSYVLVAPEGFGKTETIGYLRDRLQPEGIKFFRGSSYLKTELSRYHLFNEILNDAFDEFRNRNIEELMNGYIELLKGDDSGSTVIIAEGLESVSDESRDFFLYLSRLTKKYNFKLIGSFTTNFVESSRLSRRFLQLLETEEQVKTIHLEKMKVDDFRFFLGINGYNLPDRFVNDLFRVVDGNINTLKYTLQYYEDHGIINGEKEVDDVVYRFFPIPQAVEIHYERILSELTEKQAFVAELLALIEEETTYTRLGRLAGVDDTDMLKVLSKLEKSGVVSEKGLKYDISNYRIRDFILSRMSNTRKLQIYYTMSKSDLFVELPLQMQLYILLQKGEIEYIGRIIEEQGSSIISKFASLRSLIDFLTDFLEKAEKMTYSVTASLTRCEALELLGEAEGASACYEGIISEHPSEIVPKISLARLNTHRGEYSSALELIEKIGASEKVSDTEIGLLYLAKGSVLLKKREYASAYEITDKARNILKTAGDSGKEAEALNILGNVCLETFRHGEAMRFYEESLEINRSLGLLGNAAKNLNNIGILKSYEGEYSEAIGIFNELIENSYLTGDLVTRAYSTYNLAETYYITGRVDEVRSYIPSAIKLVELADRNDLKYRFFRFLSILYLNELEVRSSLEASEKALEAVNRNKDGELYKIAYAMKEFSHELVTGEKSDILPSLFLEELPEDEEFLPIFYSMAAIFFVFRGDFENANNAADICIRRAADMGERYGVLMSIVHKGLVLFYQGDEAGLEKYLESCPPPDTGVRKYDYLIRALEISCMAGRVSRDEFMGHVKSLSKDERSTINLVRLYKETIVFLSLKRKYGEIPEMKEMLEIIPNNFKYAFNSFAENTSIT